MSTYEELLELETALWDSTIREIPLWALVRWHVYIYLDMRTNHLQSIKKVNSRIHWQVERWSRYLRTAAWLLDGRKQWDTAFLVQSARYSSDNQHSIDRLYTPYYVRIERPLILESNLQAEWPLPDKNKHDIFSQDLLWFIAKKTGVPGRSNTITSSEKSLIENFISQVIEIFDVTELKDELYTTITTLLKQIHIIQIFIRKFVVARLLNPVVFLDLAAYMGHRAIITQELHRNGIKVVEIQHGFVGPAHQAYNYPEAILTDATHPARSLLPDIFLTHGAYWSDSIRFPAEKVVIGSPHLSKIARKYNHNSDKLAPQILVISSYIVTERTIEVVKELSCTLKNFQIIMKLHPQETAQQAEIVEALPRSNVQVIGDGNIFALIAQSKIIVSLYPTTVLAEAVAFHNKRIFCSDVGNYPPEMTHQFTTADELIELIQDPQTGYPQVDAERFWAPDWENRLNQFIADYL